MELRRNYWDAPQMSSEHISKLEDPTTTNGTNGVHHYAAGDRHGRPDRDAHNAPLPVIAETTNEKVSEIDESEIS